MRVLADRAVVPACSAVSVCLCLCSHAQAYATGRQTCSSSSLSVHLNAGIHPFKPNSLSSLLRVWGRSVHTCSVSGRTRHVAAAPPPKREASVHLSVPTSSSADHESVPSYTLAPRVVCPRSKQLSQPFVSLAGRHSTVAD